MANNRLKKALAYTSKERTYGRLVDRDDCEVALEYFSGNLTTGQIAHAFGLPKGHARSKCLSIIARGIRQGIIEPRLIQE